jgi:hypothetical protein
MFYPGSRYATAGTYQVTTHTGDVITATRIPLAQAQPILGFHRRSHGERLDLLAFHYLDDATAAWRLGQTNGAMSLDALGSHETVAIPRKP